VAGVTDRSDSWLCKLLFVLMIEWERDFRSKRSKDRWRFDYTRSAHVLLRSSDNDSGAESQCRWRIHLVHSESRQLL
jgi:hypothetical protein